MKRRSLLCGLALAAGLSGALAQAGTSLVVLPAPAAAWHTVVGTWGHQAELAGDSVVVPGPHHVAAMAWGDGGRHEAVQLNLSCFVRKGADFSRVRLPFALEGAGSGRASVANVRITREALATTLPCPDHRTESFTPAPQAESFSIDWWMPLHQQKLQEKSRLIAAGTPPRVVLLARQP
jgi:hypothetical protein